MTDRLTTLSLDPSTPPPAPLPRQRLVEILSSDVTPQVEAIARQLIANGDAMLVKNSRNAVHGFVLDQDHYDTRLEWTPTELHAVCACETRAGGFVCPHLWATVLLADRSGAFRSLEEAHAHPIFSRGISPDSAETASRRRSVNAWPARAGWKIHLASINQASARRAVNAATFSSGLPRQMIYVVDVAETRAAANSLTADNSGAIMVELQSRHQKKSRLKGSHWTKGSPIRLEWHDVESFTEAEDREILARIIGARVNEPPPLINGESQPASTGIKLAALRGHAGLDLLRRICQTGRARLRTAALAAHGTLGDTIPLAWDDGPPYQFIVRIAPHDDGKHYTLTGHLRRGELILPISALHMLAEPAPGAGLAFLDNHVARAELSGGVQWLELFTTRGPLHVPRADAHEFLRQVAALPTIPIFDLPEDLAFEQFVGVPRPRLVLRRPARQPGIGTLGASAAKIDERIVGNVLFDYDAGPIDAATLAAGTYDPVIRKMILRDKSAENKAIATLKGIGFRKIVDPDTADSHYELPPRLLPSTVPALIREGWIVEAEGKLYRAATDFRVSVASGIDWFDLTGSVQFGDQVVPLPRLLSAARKGEHLIKLADGTFGVLPEEWLARYGVIVQSGTAVKDESGKEAIRFSRAQAGMLDVLLESQPQASVDATFQNLRAQLKEFGGVTALEPPPQFVGQLRPYQREGLGWFSFLRQFSFGGCLADDMGLGKTIQVLALLASRSKNALTTAHPESNGQTNGAVRANATQPNNRPSLVVAPRSLVFNWREEALRFAPTLRILDHTGPSRFRSTDRFSDYDVILTTYGTLRSDIVFLKDYNFDYAILDEAQAIKNAQTESAKAVRLLRADYRLALSGTPVQNHLGELWSLFEFLNPGMLGAAAVFDARFQPAKAIAPPVAPAPAESAETTAETSADSAAETAAETAAEEPAEAAAPDPVVEAQLEEDDPNESPRILLSRALRPFILRRTKEQVAQDLPPCTEQTIICELDESQRAMYDELRDHYRQALLGAGKSGATPGGAAPNRMQVLEALLRLRQAACHPGLIDKTRVGEPSAKLDMLFTQLDEILEEGHKALVFSQFTSLLSIVRRRLDDPKRPVQYAYLDGKTRDRKSPVEQFQNDPNTKLFLISLKAGGLGLNLTGADYVFLLDPWWNPAVEAQAIDRAHRIGQTRHVFAYRLIAKGTVEEKVLQLQQTKRDLADAIISEDNAVLSNLTSDDLQILLS